METASFDTGSGQRTEDQFPTSASCSLFFTEACDKTNPVNYACLNQPRTTLYTHTDACTHTHIHTLRDTPTYTHAHTCTHSFILFHFTHLLIFFEPCNHRSTSKETLKLYSYILVYSINMTIGHHSNQKCPAGILSHSDILRMVDPLIH